MAPRSDTVLTNSSFGLWILFFPFGSLNGFFVEVAAVLGGGSHQGP